MKSLDKIPHLLALESRPTRGAWIEIAKKSGDRDAIKVAPHTGRVD